MLGKERVSRVYEHADGSRTSLSIRHLSAALILFGASHTFWRYPLRALFATRPKHPKPARTPASTPDPHHARSTTNPSNSLFYQVKLGTRGVRAVFTLLYPKLSADGGAKGIRTPDLFHAMEARYQLRHSPVFSSSRLRPVKHSGTPADS